MKIGIIALGWLGQQLAMTFKDEGHEIVGSYAHEPKRIEGEFRYDVNRDPYPEALKDCDLVIFNLPPSKIDSLDIFQSFLKNVSGRFIFVSSTSVYGQKGEVDENSTPLPESKNGKFLIECEELVGKLQDYCIIRPGGLYGKGRHPAKYMSGRTVSAGKEERVNLISGEALTKLISKAKNSAPEIINAINSHHPLKEDYYSEVCRSLGIELPKFELCQEEGKLVFTQYPEFKISSSL